jgi:hypothetical protein
MTPEGNIWPLRDIFWPSFVNGRLSLNESRRFSDAPTRPSIWATRCLHGLPSLIPLLVVWLALAALWSRLECRAALGQTKGP